MAFDFLGPHHVVKGAAPVILTLAVLACPTGMNPIALAGENPTAMSVPIPVAVDIRPGLCPNHLRIESPLTIPIAVLGTMDFEVANVEPSTIRLSRNGIADEVGPIIWAYADVGSPLVGGLCSCHKLRGDGLDDLELYFSIQDLAATLGLEGHSGETIPLTLSGKLMTGEDIEGVDCAVVISELWRNEEFGDEIGVLTCVGEEPAVGHFKFAYYTMVSDHVTFAIYDVQGQVVVKLIDMDMAPGIYHATWNGTSQSGEKVPTGTYFARLSNSWTSDTRKIVTLQ